jgi:outer membrane protein OmpU
MSAGFAAADVSVSGDARMGIVSSDGDSTFSNRVRIKFSGSGTTDGGLAFGGSFRAHEATDAKNGTAGSVFISGAFGKVSMGDVDSGDAAAVGQLSSVGYTGLGSGNSIAYAADGGVIGFGENDPLEISAAAARVLYTYSAGAVTVNISTAQIDNSDTDTANVDFYGSSSYGVGVSYTTGGATVAVGYGSVSGTDAVSDEDVSLTDTSASVSYAMGDSTVKAIYQNKVSEVENEEYISVASMGASVDHKIDALTVTAYAVSSEYTSPYYNDESYSLNRMGLGVAYDLGGGAAFKAGWAQIEEAVEVNNTTVSESASAFDAGLTFSF